MLNLLKNMLLIDKCLIMKNFNLNRHSLIVSAILYELDMKSVFKLIIEI
jgi:hypothetical protein